MSLGYRPAVTSDMRFVYDSFLASYRTSPHAGLICMDDWREVMAGQFHKLLDRQDTYVYVAFRPDEDSTDVDVYGWLAVSYQDIPLVLYAYVKQPYRKLGIMKGMLKKARINTNAIFYYAAKTPITNKIKRKFPFAQWHPLNARYAHQKGEAKSGTKTVEPKGDPGKDT